MIEVVVALIGAVSVILVALVEKGRRENKTDHNMVASALERIEVKIDTHINDHAKGAFDQ
jgi:hypothetical protein